MSPWMQLNKYLALCGIASRRKANALILQRRVWVNGKPVERLGVTVNPTVDSIALDGNPLRAPEQFYYFLLNKPAGVLTTVYDSRGRNTVMDLVPLYKGLYPVGRLDKDTEGVLLITNDGNLAYRLAHPKYEIEKVYEAWVQGKVKPQHIEKLHKGVSIAPNIVVKGEAKILRYENGNTLLKIQIHQGKKRQVKRMCKAIGFPVLALTRTHFGGLTAEGLERGKYRELTSEEVRNLYRMTGLIEYGRDD